MRRIILSVFFLIFLFLFAKTSLAASPIKVDISITPIPCPKGIGLVTPYYNACSSLYPARGLGESCASTYADFLTDPQKKHFWVEDPQVTAQGHSNERSREFLFWVLNKNVLDNHPVLTSIWNNSRNVALFFTILISAILGIGLIIGQRMQFELKIQVWPIIYKIIGALIFITFSATIVILLIQMSELMMKFFNETLGGKDLFNIYFQGSNKESSYTTFIGCRDLNIRTYEGANTELFMLKLTDITYYVMGSMLLLRKIILWFMLFVSPFLAILLSIALIRNTGIVWIGVFFQWLLYGPLVSLFLGATAKIWKSGIPFTFDFSRVNTPAGYIYPTAINILYGGPAQHPLKILNNANYIDTFSEYVITLLMLWAVIFFPWWLLRIFRDYCCDGIIAMKNILLSMYDQMRGSPSPTPAGPNLTGLASTALKMPQKIEVPIETRKTVKLEKIEDVKKAKTEEIVKSMDISASRLADVARLETSKTTKDYAAKNISFLQNPMKAATPTERQQYMNIKSELFQRAVKNDKVAKQVLSSVSSSRAEQLQKREEIIKSMEKVPVTRLISIKIKIPQEKVSSLTSSFVNQVSLSNQALSYLSQTTNLPQQQVQAVLASLEKNIDRSPTEIVKNISEETKLKSAEVTTIFKKMYEFSKTNKEIVDKIAQAQKINAEEVEKTIYEQVALISEPEKNIEKIIAMPATVSIEDYEEVKKMWKQHYEKGEVPVSPSVQNRDEWVDQDVVFITNTLNKLLSSDESLKNQGLDELGYILPVFMINNFKGDEVLVYLKAKLEAAKEVSEQTEREKNLTEKLQSEQVEFVDVGTKKKEVEKTMNLEAAKTIGSEESKAS